VCVLLVLAMILVSSINAASADRNPDQLTHFTITGERRYLRADRAAAQGEPASGKKRFSDAKLKKTLNRVKLPPVSMKNRMWNKMLTPMFESLYAKEIDPSQVSTYLAKVKYRPARDQIAVLYKTWHSKRAA
uniref:RxLR effector protein n=1 Tax=Phytophthora ramorum TaxID=164328 RepID=H3G7G3_PHYRM